MAQESTMERKSLFDNESLKSTLARIDLLTPTTQPEWGSMSSAQMLAHCCNVQDVANGKPLDKPPFFLKLMSGFIKKVVHNDKPYPRDSRTPAQYVASEDRDFEIEKKRFQEALHIFTSLSDEELDGIIHTLWGKTTKDEKGWAMYKHLDHHLTQFGV